jgi:hypothetical protein
MIHLNVNIRNMGRRTFLFASVLPILVCMAGARGADRPINLALHKPASASSIENDEHNAARANDGDPDTCWRADDEPEGGAEWWQVDLEKPADLSGCQIRWPYPGKTYCFKVEGSSDGKTWVILSDQTATASKAQVRKLKFENAKQIRYVKITVTRFEEGCWASISEVKIFGLP